MWLFFMYAHLWCTANSWLKFVRLFLTSMLFQKFDISYHEFSVGVTGNADEICISQQLSLLRIDDFDIANRLRF